MTTENMFPELKPDREHCWYCGCKLSDPKDCIVSSAEAENRRHRGRVQAALRGVPFDWNTRNPKLLQMRTEDHQTPRVRGGRDASDNLVDACLSCNTSKGDKTLEEYRTWVYDRTPEGCARKLAVEILGAWQSMPDDCRDNVTQLIARIDEISLKSAFRFYAERTAETKTGGVA